MSLRVIPVLDVKAGRAVHAVGGQRAHYQPVRSGLHPDSDPVGLARSFRETLGFHELYVADLDAIAGAPPALSLYRALGAVGLRTWVDAGVRDAEDVAPLIDAQVATIVVGLETVRGPSELAAILSRIDPARILFSLDLRDGIPITADGASWGSADPLQLVDAVLELGVRRVLLLDLARVGRGRGTGTLGLLELLVERQGAGGPEREWVVGGGIAGLDVIVALAKTGASTVLVGSALHDGRIGRAELARLENREISVPS
jgi:phosphoribosylformimino-5-aminoimidazole carboxamide ribotide isomerase